MSLLSSQRSDVCFEQIKGNFWYGVYGEFRVVIMRDNGWVNATKMCKSGGKEFKHWIENAGSKHLVKILENLHTEEARSPSSTCGSGEAGIPTTGNLVMKRVLTQKKTDEDKLIEGVYVHSDLVPSIAGWISPEFQIKCNRIINGLINRVL